MPKPRASALFSLVSSAMLFHQPAYSLDPVATPPSPSQPCPDIAPGPVPLSELVLTLRPRNADPDLAAVSTIRNTLALYPFAIDTRSWSALDGIFSTDARANYSNPLGVLEGREAIKTALQQSLEMPFKGTQHMYGSQLIRVCSPTSAISITYFTAWHFLVPGNGPETIASPAGILYANGHYQDTWERQGGEVGWRITNRNLVYSGPLIADASLGNQSQI